MRKHLFSRGLRYYKNDKRYPGKPDIVFPKYKTVVFVNGCFWHSHNSCSDFVIPKTNTEFWIAKLHDTVERDRKNASKLQEMGWNVLVVWECDLKKHKIDITLEKLYVSICSNAE